MNIKINFSRSYVYINLKYINNNVINISYFILKKTKIEKDKNEIIIYGKIVNKKIRILLFFDISFHFSL